MSETSHATRLMIRARQSIAGVIEEAGGCDHSVGVCACADISLVDEIDRELVKQFGTDVIRQFYWAEPTHTYENRGPGVEWAKAAQAMLARIMSEKVRGLAEPEE